MTAIVKYQPRPDLDAFLLAMWLMYARAPRRAEPDVDGCFDLGDIGSKKLGTVDTILFSKGEMMRRLAREGTTWPPS